LDALRRELAGRDVDLAEQESSEGLRRIPEEFIDVARHLASINDVLCSLAYEGRVKKRLGERLERLDITFGKGENVKLEEGLVTHDVLFFKISKEQISHAVCNDSNFDGGGRVEIARELPPVMGRIGISGLTLKNMTGTPLRWMA